MCSILCPELEFLLIRDRGVRILCRFGNIPILWLGVFFRSNIRDTCGPLRLCPRGRPLSFPDDHFSSVPFLVSGILSRAALPGSYAGSWRFPLRHAGFPFDFSDCPFFSLLFYLSYAWLRGRSPLAEFGKRALQPIEDIKNIGFRSLDRADESKVKQRKDRQYNIHPELWTLEFFPK